MANTTAATPKADPTVCTNKPSPSLTLAVASNLWEPAQFLASTFEERNPGVIVEVCHNSTGELERQIIAGGSGYDIFLAANTETPIDLCSNYSSLCYPTTDPPSDSVFNYAIGILVLWSHRNIDLTDGLDLVDNPEINSLAYADPGDAPYGKATQQTLEQTGQWNNLLGSKLVNPPYSNIDLTYRAVLNETNDAGFIAKSQICNNGNPLQPYVEYDHSLYDQIIQAGTILNTNHTTLAESFKTFLLSDSTNPQTQGGQTILTTKFCYVSALTKKSNSSSSSTKNSASTSKSKTAK
ncbi:MAG: molybdate ABC transporter substrate-binding protein [Deltaproteobacteria bacterium]|nr:molybdate ABC transporter substrate-binding protein [Deltaproteobacteria bacterium]